MISEKIGGFYASIEDKWYALVDALQEKGIPLGSYADFLDNHGIPSFLFTVLVIVLLAAGIFAYVYIGMTIDSTVTVSVIDYDNNPVLEATITAKDSGGNLIGKITGYKVELKGIKPGTKVTFYATKTGYESVGGESNKIISITEKDESVALKLKNQPLTGLDVKFLVVDEITAAQVQNATVIAELQNNQNQKWPAEFNTEDKYYHLVGIPVDTELMVRIRADSYEDLDTLKKFSANSAETFYISPKSAQFLGVSKLVVYVKDADTQEPIDQAEIEIRNKITDAPIYSGLTENGEYVADEAPRGVKLRVLAGKTDTDYLKYDSMETGEEIVLSKEEETLAILLSHGGKKLTVYTNDMAGQAIPNVTVRVYDSSNKLIGEKNSQFSGIVEFDNLNPDENYTVVGYAEGLLPARASARISDSPETALALDYATAENSANVNIYTIDETYNAVENATIKLFEIVNENELPIGIPDAKSDLTGYASVRAPVGIKLLARAVKETMEGEGTVEVSLNVSNEIKITLSRSDTIKQIYFKGIDGSAIKGNAIVKAKDGTVLYEGPIGEDGSIMFDSLGNDVFDVYATDENGKEFSEEVNMKGLDIYEVDFTVKEVLGIEPKMTFNGVLDDLGNEVEGISAGKFYWLKFETVWAAGDYKGGVHIRVGSDDVKFADSQDIGILGFDATADDSFYGTSYSPMPAPGNEGIDSQNRGKAGEYNKWLDLYFNNPADTTIIKVKVQARETTSIDTFEVKFRAWAIVGSEYYRYPADDILGKDEYNSKKTGLYAETLSQQIKVLESPAASCTSGTCVSYKFIDEDGIEYEEASFKPAVNKNYELVASILSDFDNSVKIRASTSKTNPKLFITGYFVSEDAKDEGKELTSLDIDNVPVVKEEEKGLSIFFKTSKEGVAKLNVQVIAGTNTLNKEFNFNIEGEKQLSLEVSPSEINVGEDFTLEITDKDDVKITNAAINLQDATGNIASSMQGDAATNTGANGLYFFKNIFAPGNYILKASVAGYKSADLAIEIKASGTFEIAPEIIFYLTKQLTSGTATQNIRNNANYIVDQVSFELDNEEEFSNNFTLAVDLPPSIQQGDDIVAPFTVEYKGAQPDSSLYAEALVTIRGFIAGKYEVKGETTVKVNFNKRLESDCLKVDKSNLQLYLTGSSGTSKQAELTIENQCGVPLELAARILARNSDPNLEVTASPVTINAGEKQNVTIDVLNKIDRAYANPMTFNYTVIYESPQISKGVPLSVLLWNPMFSLTASDNLVLWLSKSSMEEKARAIAPIFIRNTGPVPVQNISFSIRSDFWQKNGISVTLVPGETVPMLAGGQAVIPVRSVLAEADLEQSLAAPVPGEIIISGTIDGRQYDSMRVVRVWVHVSGFECLKAYSDEALLFQSEESGSGALSKKITVRNECAEEVKVTAIEPSQFGQNSIILHPLSAVQLMPNASADFELILQKRQDYSQDNIQLVVKGLLIRTQKFVEAHLTASIQLGENAALASEAATSPQEIKVCGTDEVKVINYPLIGTDCSRNYCDARNLSIYIADKLQEAVVEAKSKAYRGSFEASNFAGCGIDKQYCSFASLGVLSRPFAVYMQNDYLNEKVLQHELSASNIDEVKDLRVSISNADLGAVVSTGWAKQLYLSSDIKGCGKYTFTIDGAMQVSNGRILEDNFVLLLKKNEEGRALTAECQNKIQNVMNFLPVDEGYTVLANYDSWPGIVKKKTGLETLEKSFSKELFGVEDRAASSPPNNKLVLDFGDTQGGILKLEIDKTGASNSPKTVYAYINRAYETGDEELKGKIATEAAKAIASLTEQTVDGCISPDESYFIIMSYEEYGILSLDTKDFIRLSTREICIDGNVSSEFPEQVKLRTDFSDRLANLTNSEAGIEYVKLLKLDGTEISQDEILTLEKPRDKQYYEYKFRLCVKGSPQFNLALENMREIKVIATSVSIFNNEGTATASADETENFNKVYFQDLGTEQVAEVITTGVNAALQRFQPVEKIVAIKVCVIHPYDLFRDLSTAEPGRYYATIGWSGDLNEVNSIDIWRALYRDNLLNEQGMIVNEGGTAGGGELGQAFQNIIGSKKNQATWWYWGTCTATSLACGGITSLSVFGGIWDAIFDCTIPALLYATGDLPLMKNIKNWIKDRWGDVMGLFGQGESPTVETPEDLGTGGNAPEIQGNYSDLLGEQVIGVTADAIARWGHVALVELTPATATSIADSIAGNLEREFVRNGLTQDAARTISGTFRTNMYNALMRIYQTTDPRAQMARRNIAGVLTGAYNTAMGETSTAHFNLLADPTSWESGALPASARTAQTNLLNTAFDSGTKDNIANAAKGASNMITNDTGVVSTSSKTALKRSVATRIADDIIRNAETKLNAPGAFAARRNDLIAHIRGRLNVTTGVPHTISPGVPGTPGSTVTDMWGNVTTIPPVPAIDPVISIEIKIDDAQLRSVVDDAVTTFGAYDEVGERLSKEIIDQLGRDVAADAGKLTKWQNFKKAFAGMFSWKGMKAMGWGVGCGVLSNLAGTGAWNLYWQNNYTDPAATTPVFYGPGQGNNVDDDEDGRIDEETCDGIDNDGDGNIDEDCGDILSVPLMKYSTYRIDITQSAGSTRKVISMREVSTDADIQLMEDDLANNRATRLDEKYCQGEFMEKDIQIVFGSLSPPDSEGERKIIYYTRAIQEPVVNAAIEYKDAGVTEAMLMAIVFEQHLDQLSADQFATKIREVAEQLRQLRVSCEDDDECLMRTYAEQNGITGPLVQTYNTWNGYKIDWEETGGGDAGSGTGDGRTLGTAEIQQMIIAAARSHGVPPEIALAVAEKESSMNHYNADGSVKRGGDGEYGMFQIMPGTGSSNCGMSGTQLEVLENNIECGVTILKNYYDSYRNGCAAAGVSSSQCENCQNGNYREWEAALRGYNGWSCASRYANYVGDVMSAAADYESVVA